jgi:hypothetical protein
LYRRTVCEYSAEELYANVTLLKKKNRVDCEMLAKMPRASIPAFYVYSAVGKNSEF